MSASKTAPQEATGLPVKLSNPDKIFWPEEGYSKLDLAEFYAGILTTLQPYLDDGCN
jgi:bifunctional non-homologous end joining protein LigD